MLVGSEVGLFIGSIGEYGGAMFLILECMLCSKFFVWKCGICSVRGHSEGEAIYAMVWRRREYCFSMVGAVWFVC